MACAVLTLAEDNPSLPSDDRRTPSAEERRLVVAELLAGVAHRVRRGG